MGRIAIVGGTGLTELPELHLERSEQAETPYGRPSAPLLFGRLLDAEVVFLARHGNPHKLPPHRINYRANLWALKQAGVDRIVAVNAVGGINPDMGCGHIAITDDVVDYTWGRAHTYSDGPDSELQHVDFSEPYDAGLRRVLAKHANELGLTFSNRGVYAATQGPRLESPAEIRRLWRDGCDVVGMTGMPEAGLARELGIRYACVALVVNPAAGVAEGEITMDDIARVLAGGMGDVTALLRAALPELVSA